MVRNSVERGRALGPLLAVRGTVQREVFEEAFGDLLKDLLPDADRSQPEKAISKPMDSAPNRTTSFLTALTTT